MTDNRCSGVATAIAAGNRSLYTRGREVPLGIFIPTSVECKQEHIISSRRFGDYKAMYLQ